MRHVTIEGPGRVVVAEAPDPVPPGPGGAVVSVDATAICGSDMHFYDGDLDLGMAVPVGHEFLGTVLEVGPDVRSFRPGDRVLTASVAGCGACDGCATGDPVRCVEGPKVFGSGMLPAGQATAVAVPAADFQMLRIPEGMDDEAALLLTDNLSTGWAGAQRAEFPPGGHGGRSRSRGRRAVRGALRAGCSARPGCWPSTPSRGAGRGPWRRGPRRWRVRRSRPCSRRRAASDPTPSSTRWPRTRRSTPRWPRCGPGGTVSVVGVHDLEPYPLAALTTLFRA